MEPDIDCFQNVEKERRKRIPSCTTYDQRLCKREKWEHKKINGGKLSSIVKSFLSRSSAFPEGKPRHGFGKNLSNMGTDLSELSLNFKYKALTLTF